MENGRANILVFDRSGGRDRLKVLVIGAAVYPQNPAESFDAMLKTKLMNGV